VGEHSAKRKKNGMKRKIVGMFKETRTDTQKERKEEKNWLQSSSATNH
jgi:hypothetical protein